jgi:hypothetical protein
MAIPPMMGMTPLMVKTFEPIGCSTSSVFKVTPKRVDLQGQCWYVMALIEIPGDIQLVLGISRSIIGFAIFAREKIQVVRIRGVSNRVK